MQRLLGPSLQLQLPKPPAPVARTEIKFKPKKPKKITKEQKLKLEQDKLQEERSKGLVAFGVQITLPPPRRMEPPMRERLPGQIEDRKPCAEDPEHDTECVPAAKNARLYWRCLVCKDATGTFAGKPKWIGWDGEETKPSRKQMEDVPRSTVAPKRAKLETGEASSHAFAQGTHVSLLDLSRTITSIDLKLDLVQEQLTATREAQAVMLTRLVALEARFGTLTYKAKPFEDKREEHFLLSPDH